MIILISCKNMFLVFDCALCLLIGQSSQICSKMVTFLLSVYLAAIFVTIATVKVELIGDFYTLVIVLINQQE